MVLPRESSKRLQIREMLFARYFLLSPFAYIKRFERGQCPRDIKIRRTFLTTKSHRGPRSSADQPQKSRVRSLLHTRKKNHVSLMDNRSDHRAERERGQLGKKAEEELALRPLLPPPGERKCHPAERSRHRGDPVPLSKQRAVSYTRGTRVW